MAGIYMSGDEYQARLQRVRQLLEGHNLDALCVFNAITVYYLTGYAYQPTERPICLVVPRYTEPAIVLPLLEQEHVQKIASLKQNAIKYPEYPGRRHPLEYLRNLLVDLGLERARLGADASGYGSIYGSRGPTLNELCPQAQIVIFREQLERMRMIKSPREIQAIRESARFENLAHSYLQEHIRVGVTEIEVGQEASLEASRVVLKAFGPNYHLSQWGTSPVHAGLKAGPSTAWPHPMASARKMQPGDLIITWATVMIDGYHAELERTLILGKPTDTQWYYFEHMCALQEVGLTAIRPGRTCADVERDVQQEASRRGLNAFLRHHTGHALGLEIHEPPYLDFGDETVIEPGMVFSIEPGLYIEGIGGFRHSDTVLVTETGCEILSYYPRNLASLVVPT